MSRPRPKPFPAPRLALLGLLCLATVHCGPEDQEGAEGTGEETGTVEQEGRAGRGPGWKRDAGTVTDAGAAPAPAPDAGAGGGSAGQLDADGVVMLATPNPDGASWRLGTQDPNQVSSTYFVNYGDAPTKVVEGPLTFWTTTGELITYSDGSPDGRTARFYMRPGGGTQRYGWNSGAQQYGYLATSRDLKNFEATAYVRVRGNLGKHVSMSWLLRGGSHSSSQPDFSSCTGMQIPWTGQSAKAFREYTHPNYDYIYLTPKFTYNFVEGKWLGTKVLSWKVTGGTMNRLYLDTDPFDAQGKPRNNFRLYLEWNDRSTDTGRYTVPATWGGWQTSMRIDGWRNTDFTLLSAREILPP
ncbi:MAG TPA: hypothetical protein VFO83_02975 [Aggregicoccus sp.]|nr:hypothetical protein [Aggregicoccus sp.]